MICTLIIQLPTLVDILFLPFSCNLLDMQIQKENPKEAYVWIPVDLDEILCQIASPDDEQMAVRCLIIQPRLVVLYATIIYICS